MKRILVLLTVFVMLALSACNNTSNIDVATESVPADYRKSIEIAKSEFLTLFSEFEELEITNTSTMTRTDDASHIVIEISYSSKNGDGVYGFEMKKDEYGNYELLKQGEDVTINNLVNQSLN